MDTKSISKKTRFEIFKRDNFRCVYCGKQPPDVTLELEHIIPRASGGRDVYEKYCTSCFDCNRGKGATPLDCLPPDALSRLAAIQERLEEINTLRMQSKLASKLHEEITALRDTLDMHWCLVFSVDSAPKQVISMMVNRLQWIQVPEMYKLIDSCAMRMSGKSESSCAKYMSGILRNHLASIGIDYQKEIGVK